MVIEAFILSLLIGFIRRGSLKSLAAMPINHAYLFLVACLLFPATYILAYSGIEIPVLYIRIMNVAQYVILLAAVGLNLGIKQMWLIGIGIFMNFLVIAFNHGVMPVSRWALDVINKPDALGDNPVRHAIMTSETNFAFLADILPIPSLNLFGREILPPEVASIGDVVISVGIFLLIQYFMCGRKSQVEEKSVIAQ